MTLKSALVLAILCCLLCSTRLRAEETLFACDLVQNRNGVSAPETVVLDAEQGTIRFLKRVWKDGGRVPVVDRLEQFVAIDDQKLTWGERRKDDGLVVNLFILARGTGALSWRNSVNVEIGHGACRSPAATS